MSPTKASLARFYPSLLPRAKSAEPPRPVSREERASAEKFQVGEGATNGARAYVAGTTSEGPIPPTNGVEKGHGLLATPRGRSQDPKERDALTYQGKPVTSPELRASPPEEVRYEDTSVSGMNGEQQELVAEAADMGNAGVTIVPDIQNPQFPSTPTQREPYVPTSGMGIGEDGEPSLPSTPSQLGLKPPREWSESPLSNSLRKRPRRKVRPAAKLSPLKPPAVLSEHSNQMQQSHVVSLGPRRYIANTPKPPPSSEEAQLLQMRTRLSDLEKQLQGIQDKLLRQLLVSSWQQDRSRDGKDVAKRRKDVAQRSTKIVQLREDVQQIEAAQSINHGPAGLEAHDREIAPTTTSTLAQRLAKFLPFAIKPPPTEPRPPSPQTKDITQVPDLDNLQTTAEPFTVTTSDTLLLPPTENKGLLQRQEIHLSTPNQLLKCDLKLTTNIATQKISHLTIQALSSWAEPELGSWLRQPHDQMDLASLGSAFGRYWEVASLRSNCWISCRQNFKDLVTNAPPSDSLDNTLSYLGIQDLVLARSNVQLELHWGISLNNKGEVESQSSACAKFPPAWHHRQGVNGGEELAKIGEAFSMLVEDRGITEAVGMVCRIVFPI